MMRTLFFALLCSSLLGCGDDAADSDAGPPTLDAGPPGVDAGPSDVDAGPSDVDAGPSDVDAGPETTDAGPSDVDAGPAPDGGAACAFFDGLERGCSNDESCSVAIHQSDCCGTLVARGINHSERERFEMLEPLCVASYPGCGCAGGPTMSDSGEVVTDMASLRVGCIIGPGPGSTCMTYVSMRPEDMR